MQKSKVSWATTQCIGSSQGWNRDAQSVGQSTKMLGAQTLVKLTEYCIIKEHEALPSFHEITKVYVCCTMPTPLLVC